MGNIGNVAQTFGGPQRTVCALENGMIPFTPVRGFMRCRVCTAPPKPFSTRDGRPHHSGVNTTSGTVGGPHGAQRLLLGGRPRGHGDVKLRGPTKDASAPVSRSSHPRDHGSAHGGVQTCYSKPDQRLVLKVGPPGCTARSSRATSSPPFQGTGGFWKVRMPGTQEVAPVATGHCGGEIQRELKDPRRSDEDQ